MRNSTLPKVPFFLFFCCFSITSLLHAQEEAEQPTFFTGLSPIILEQNAAEINVINSFNSFWIAQKQFRPDAPSVLATDRKRFTSVEHLLRASYGFSKKKTWDLGVELKISEARLDEAARSSPFRVFGNSEVGGKSYRGLSSIGVRARMIPFKNIPELTLQATAAYPMARKPETRAIFNAQSTQLGLAATYFVQSGDRNFYFFQVDWLTRLKNDEAPRTQHSPALSAVMVIKLWNDEWFVFPGLSYGTTLQQFSNGGLYRLNQSLFGTGGVFYQPSPKFSVVLNFQLPLIYSSTLRSVELVRESYSGFTLGVRSLL